MSEYRMGHVRVGDYEGLAAVIPGHDLPSAIVTPIVEHLLGEGRYQSEETHWSVQKRVLWCERHGDPCDSNGEDWHTHWHPVMPNPDEDTHFTVAWLLPEGEA